MVAELAPDGTVLRIRDNPLRPDQDYRLCPRGARAMDEALHEGRLTTPLKRVGRTGRGALSATGMDGCSG